jgi:tetratricopeptide (TPR) repeat protein
VGGIHIGRSTAGSSLYGALLYDRDHHRHLGRRCYPRDHYYHLYYPIHDFAYSRYRPWGGYTYTSVYYAEPYVYRFYDTDVRYVEDVREETGEYEAGISSPVEPVEGPPASDVAYQLLTEADDTTLIGRGNAAFLAGRYDEAREYYVTALLADERDGYAKFLYALANFAAGDYDVAAMAVRRALLTTPELIDYPADVRALYADSAILEVQLHKLVRFVQDHPRDRGAQLLLGYLYFAGGDPGRALLVVGGLSESDRDDEVAALLRDAVMRVGQGRQPGE